MNTFPRELIQYIVLDLKKTYIRSFSRVTKYIYSILKLKSINTKSFYAEELLKDNLISDLLANKVLMKDNQLPELSVKYGSLDIIKVLRNNKYFTHKYAIKYDHTHLIYYFENNLSLNLFHRDIRRACTYGSLNCIKWFHNAGYIDGIDCALAIREAVINGYISVLYYFMIEQNNSWSKEYSLRAVEANQQCVLEFALEYGYEWHEDTLMRAEKMNNVSLIKYIKDSNLKK